MRQDQGGGRLGSFRIRESEKLFKFISDIAKLLSNTVFCATTGT